MTGIREKNSLKKTKKILNPANRITLKCLILCKKKYYTFFFNTVNHIYVCSMTIGTHILYFTYVRFPVIGSGLFWIHILRYFRLLRHNFCLNYWIAFFLSRSIYILFSSLCLFTRELSGFWWTMYLWHFFSLCAKSFLFTCLVDDYCPLLAW